MAREKASPFYALGETFRWLTEEGDSFSWCSDSGDMSDLVLGIEGQHQKDNASVAIAAVLALPSPPKAAAIRQGLANARHAGRMEWLARDVLVDCAHNAAGAERLADYLRNLPKDGVWCSWWGCLKTKMPQPLLAHWRRSSIKSLHAMRPPRALDCVRLAEQLVDIHPGVLSGGRIEEALPRAVNQGELVVAAGSVFLAGAVRDMLGRQ